MFRRITFEEWQAIITLGAFVLFFSIFLLLTIRAIRMKREKRDHAANLPLLSDEDIRADVARQQKEDPPPAR